MIKNPTTKLKPSNYTNADVNNKQQSTTKPNLTTKIKMTPLPQFKEDVTKLFNDGLNDIISKITNLNFDKMQELCDLSNITV